MAVTPQRLQISLTQYHKVRIKMYPWVKFEHNYMTGIKLQAMKYFLIFWWHAYKNKGYPKETFCDMFYKTLVWQSLSFPFSPINSNWQLSNIRYASYKLRKFPSKF